MLDRFHTILNKLYSFSKPYNKSDHINYEKQVEMDKKGGLNYVLTFFIVFTR